MVSKLALLVGCNYSNNNDVPVENKLHGCINDVKAMQALIRQRFGFENKNITILTDETEKKPTRLNIMDELNRLIDAAKQGDILLFYFSGGGALDKPTGIPMIVPWDLKPIPGDYILPIFDRLPDGATITFICDSSYSGGLFDKKGENVQIESNVLDYVHNFGSKTIPSDLLPSMKLNTNLPGISLNNTIRFSSSRVNEESVEVYLNRDESMAFSAYSSVIQALFNSPQAVNPTLAGNGLKAPYANREVAAFTRALLGFLTFDQHPCLIGSENAAALFLDGYVA